MSKYIHLIEEAEKLYRQGNFEETIELLHQLELEGQINMFALTLKSECLIRIAKFEEAFIAANLALKFEENSTLYSLRATALHNMGAYAQAIEDYERIQGRDAEAVKENLELVMDEQIQEMLFNDKKLLAGQSILDLDKIFFLSNYHERIENGKLIQKNPQAHRAIRIKNNIFKDENYSVIIYNLDELHPVWKNYEQVSPKQMKVTSSNYDQVELAGYGNDRNGERFSDYSILIKNDATISSITLFLKERNTSIIYTNRLV